MVRKLVFCDGQYSSCNKVALQKKREKVVKIGEEEKGIILLEQKIINDLLLFTKSFFQLAQFSGLKIT